MGHFVDHLSRDVQPKGCDVTVLNYARRRHTCERVPARRRHTCERVPNA